MGSNGVQSEINVTPLIDIVLVLLIIFMVVAPTLEDRFELSLPEIETSAEVEPPPADAPAALLVSLATDGRVSLNGETLPVTALKQRLRGALAKRHDKVVFFEASDSANFGHAVALMDDCRGAGADHVGIIDPDAAAGELPEAPGH